MPSRASRQSRAVTLRSVPCRPLTGAGLCRCGRGHCPWFTTHCQALVGAMFAAISLCYITGQSPSESGAERQCSIHDVSTLHVPRLTGDHPSHRGQCSPFMTSLSLSPVVCRPSAGQSRVTLTRSVHSERYTVRCPPRPVPSCPQPPVTTQTPLLSCKHSYVRHAPTARSLPSDLRA